MLDYACFGCIYGLVDLVNDTVSNKNVEGIAVKAAGRIDNFCGFKKYIHPKISIRVL